MLSGMPVGSRASSPQPLGHPTVVPRTTPDPPGHPEQRQRLAAALGERARPAVMADERALPVPAPLAPLLPGEHLRRGSTVAVHRSLALALALVAEASASGSWVAAVGLPDLGVVAAAEAGIALDRLALVPAPTPRTWAAVVAALLDAIDVVLVRPPGNLRAADARRLAARARERGSVLVPLGDVWAEPADLHLEVTASRWRGLGQGHGHLEARWVEVAAHGRGAAARERHAHLWLPAHSVPWDAAREPGYVRPASHVNPRQTRQPTHSTPWDASHQPGHSTPRDITRQPSHLRPAGTASRATAAEARMDGARVDGREDPMAAGARVDGGEGAAAADGHEGARPVDLAMDGREGGEAVDLAIGEPRRARPA
jgi:hypothetical protein